MSFCWELHRSVSYVSSPAGQHSSAPAGLPWVPAFKQLRSLMLFALLLPHPPLPWIQLQVQREGMSGGSTEPSELPESRSWELLSATHPFLSPEEGMKQPNPNWPKSQDTRPVWHSCSMQCAPQTNLLCCIQCLWHEVQPTYPTGSLARPRSMSQIIGLVGVHKLYVWYPWSSASKV